MMDVAAFFVNLLRAYVDGFAADELHPSQHAIARRAMQLLSMLAEKGIEAMIDEACGVLQPAMDTGAIRRPPSMAELLRARHGIRSTIIEHIGLSHDAGDLEGTRAALAALDALLPRHVEDVPAPARRASSPPSSSELGPHFSEGSQLLKERREAKGWNRNQATKQLRLAVGLVARLEDGHQRAGRQTAGPR